jgi:hypothetical protein
MTSDKFFKKRPDGGGKFDIIFIDGLHEYEQVLKDIKNSLDCLSKDGTIVLHDCMPTEERVQAVPRVQAVWTGDVWKAVVLFKDNYDEYTLRVVDTDWGVGIIQHGFQEKVNVDYISKLDWKWFEENYRKNIDIFECIARID